MLALPFLLCFCSQLFSQSGGVDRTVEIRRALQSGEHQIAADLADSAIVHFADFAPEKLSEIHALRALIAAKNNKSALVEAHFLAALQLNPQHQLDAIFFSPSLQSRFEQLRARLPKRDTPVRVETRYVTLPDPRVSAAWKSFVLPGWGQRFKGQNTKGKLFTISAATLLGATIATHVLRQQAEQNYLDASENEVAAKYDTFNRYHLLRNNFALGLGIVWGAGVFDALIVRIGEKVENAGIQPGVQASQEGMVVGVAISF